MKVESVHYEPGGIYFNTHPDLPVREHVRTVHAEDEAQATAYYNFLAQTENVNPKYATEIADARMVFEEDKQSLAPVFVLHSEDYEYALRLGAPHDDPRATQAAYLRGRIIVREGQHTQVLGKDYVLGLILHEGGHGTGEQHDVIATSKTVTLADVPEALTRDLRGHPDTPIRMLSRTAIGGFRKYTVGRDGLPDFKGEFWEEALADLTRVRGLKKLGREPLLHGRSGFRHGKIHFVAEDVARQALGNELQKDVTTLPITFAGATAMLPNGSITTYDIPASLASYGLDVLDGHLPGLFEQMKTARSNPAAYKHAIYRINELCPGLYQEIRNLKYTPDDFEHGLRLIQAATTGQMLRCPKVLAEQRGALTSVLRATSFKNK